MLRTAFVVLVVLPFAGCLAPFPSCRGTTDTPSWTAGDQNLTLCVAGRERTAILHVPPELSTPAPLLVALHGGGGSAAQMKAEDSLDGAADRLGFAVVYPDGTPAARGTDLRTWHATHCCGRALEERIDDVGFLAALIEVLERTGAVDTTRVGVAGHSNGGMMASRFAAERSDLVAVVASVAGAIGGQTTRDGPVLRPAAPAHPVSALLIHARDDSRVPFDGGEGTNAGEQRVDLAVADEVAFWRAADGLAAPPVNHTLGVVVSSSWTGGLLGTAVTLLATEGGHGWPGQPGRRLPAPLAPDAASAIGDFLLAHPRPPVS